jgi:O-acetyl-ADP-ribose deacetylase (regulator of RNase III)
MAVEFKVGKAVLHLTVGDITDIEADAIVNAANSTLMGGGGVDGAIHRKGGPKILEECKQIRVTKWPNGLPTGKAVLTSGGNLKAKFVIHTVGPVWHGGSSGEAELLRQSYMNSLELSVTKGLKSVAFPSISTGAYGYPTEQACFVALRAIKAFLENEDKLEKVIMVLYSERDFAIYLKTARGLFLEILFDHGFF